MKNLILITASLIVTASIVCAEPEIKGSATELVQFLNNVPKVVSVTGEAEMRVPARRAVVMLRVASENKSLHEALRLNAELRNKLTEQLKQQGISADRVQVSKFSSTPKFGMFSEKAKSYRVENVMRIAIQDDKEFQSAASAVDSFSEVQFGEVEFEYADREALKQKAIAQACDNANERKKIYEEKLNLKLIPVSFGEGLIMSQNAANQYGINPKYGDGMLTAGLRSPAQSGADATTEESISSFGELVYIARVKVDYSTTSK